MLPSVGEFAISSGGFFFLEIIAAIGLKAGLSFQINELMKLRVQAKGHSDFKIKTCFSGKLLSHLEPNSI